MARTGNIILTQMNNLSLESFEKKKVKNIGNMASSKNIYAKTENSFQSFAKKLLSF